MQVALPGWAPGAEWRFGLSASNSHVPDDVLVDGLELASGLLISRETRPVELTLNGQQYVPVSTQDGALVDDGALAGDDGALAGDDELAGAERAPVRGFTYYGAGAPPTLTSVRPRSG